MASWWGVWFVEQRSSGLLDFTEVCFFQLIFSTSADVYALLGDGLNSFLYMFLSSPAKGGGSCPYCPLLPPWFALYRTCYQSPVSPRQYFKSFVCYEKVLLVEGRPWLAAEQFTLISFSLQQSNLLGRVELSSRSHRSGMLLMCHQAGQKGTIMQIKACFWDSWIYLYSLIECFLCALSSHSSHLSSSRITSWLCSHADKHRTVGLNSAPLFLHSFCWALTWGPFSITCWVLRHYEPTACCLPKEICKQHVHGDVSVKQDSLPLLHGQVLSCRIKLPPILLSTLAYRSLAA